jgi:hypothetical protein
MEEKKKKTFGIHSFGSQANAAGFSSSYQPVGFCRVGFVIFKKKSVEARNIHEK